MNVRSTSPTDRSVDFGHDARRVAAAPRSSPTSASPEGTAFRRRGCRSPLSTRSSTNQDAVADASLCGMANFEAEQRHVGPAPARTGRTEDAAELGRASRRAWRSRRGLVCRGPGARGCRAALARALINRCAARQSFGRSSAGPRPVPVGLERERGRVVALQRSRSANWRQRFSSAFGSGQKPGRRARPRGRGDVRGNEDWSLPVRSLA